MTPTRDPGMTCYACGRSLSNDEALSNFGKWTMGYIDGARQPYCAIDAWCESYAFAAEVGDSHPGVSGQEIAHMRASVDPWFGEHECDSRCEWIAQEASDG